jgi:hypothetical protein
MIPDPDDNPIFLMHLRLVQLATAANDQVRLHVVREAYEQWKREYAQVEEEYRDAVAQAVKECRDAIEGT